MTGLDEFFSDRKGSDDAFDFAIEDGSFFTLGFIHSFDKKVELIADGGYKTKEKLFRKTKSEYAMVRKGERIIGHLEFTKSMLGNEKWKLKAEERK